MDYAAKHWPYFETDDRTGILEAQGREWSHKPHAPLLESSSYYALYLATLMGDNHAPWPRILPREQRHFHNVNIIMDANLLCSHKLYGPTERLRTYKCAQNYTIRTWRLATQSHISEIKTHIKLFCLQPRVVNRGRKKNLHKLEGMQLKFRFMLWDRAIKF